MYTECGCAEAGKCFEEASLRSDLERKSLLRSPLHALLFSLHLLPTTACLHGAPLDSSGLQRHVSWAACPRCRIGQAEDRVPPRLPSMTKLGPSDERGMEEV